jgi:aminoglycoside/choline kinase family phosphotransferase
VPHAEPPTPTAASQTIVWKDPHRQGLFDHWLSSIQESFGLDNATLGLASADASFRRYFRIQSGRGSLVIMDAPPDKENCKPFVDIAALMCHAGLRAPHVLHWDEANGFMLLTDLGSQTMMQTIDPTQAPPLGLYLNAVDTLIEWQRASAPGVLPPYDEALLRRELELFPEWYIGAYRQVPIDAPMRKTLDDTFALLIKNNLSWPSVYVHRDYMPRNLMVPDAAATTVQSGPAYLGVLDFQDAVYGPITYDIASLMRDAFLTWEEDFCLDVTIRYWDKARKAGLPVGDDFGEFYRGVEWMGLQRHLKVAGIFARLTLRDGKPRYLADTPRFIHYIRSTCSRYIQLKPLLRLVEKVDGIEVPEVFAFGRS